jgi:hypothetical protein
LLLQLTLVLSCTGAVLVLVTILSRFGPRYTPGPGCSDRYDFRPTPEELAEIDKIFENDLEIPYNFEQSVLAYRPTGGRPNFSQVTGMESK